jgi:hypothetical protein
MTPVLISQIQCKPHFWSSLPFFVTVAAIAVLFTTGLTCRSAAKGVEREAKPAIPHHRVGHP